jgi:hypothetical protein
MKMLVALRKMLRLIILRIMKASGLHAFSGFRGNDDYTLASVTLSCTPTRLEFYLC